jgi:hypothetical protein
MIGFDETFPFYNAIKSVLTIKRIKKILEELLMLYNSTKLKTELSCFTFTGKLEITHGL